MNELNAKKVQCEKDIEVLQEQLKKLKQEIETAEDFKVGDIVTLKDSNRERIILFSETMQRLAAYDKNGKRRGWSDLKADYRKTGDNIFKGNLLDLRENS
jgi:hypothetical protein